MTLSVVLMVGVSSCTKHKKVLGAHTTGWKQKELIITYSVSAPPTNETVKTANDEAFNLIPNAQETLDAAAKQGIKIMLEHGRLTPNIADDPAKLQELANVIEQVKNHPALEAYYLFDEPKAVDIPKVAKLVSFIRERDPKHFSFVNLLPVSGVPGYAVPIEPGVDPSKTYMKFVKNYIETVKPDLLSYDLYAFQKNSTGEVGDIGGYFANLSLIRDAARSARIPFINIIQACAFDNTFRVPNANEMRWQVYTTLAYGGRGISYFLYWGNNKIGGVYQDGKPTPILAPIVELNKEMRAMSPVLMTLDSEQVFNSGNATNVESAIPKSSPVQISTAGKYVLGLFSQEGKINHFMLVNANSRDDWNAKLKVECSALEEFDRTKSTWTAVSSTDVNTFELDFKPGDGRLFRFRQ
jgi:hypothetical protein